MSVPSSWWLRRSKAAECWREVLVRGLLIQVHGVLLNTAFSSTFAQQRGRNIEVTRPYSAAALCIRNTPKKAEGSSSGARPIGEELQCTRTMYNVDAECPCDSLSIRRYNTFLAPDRTVSRILFVTYGLMRYFAHCRLTRSGLRLRVTQNTGAPGPHSIFYITESLSQRRASISYPIKPVSAHC